MKSARSKLTVRDIGARLTLSLSLMLASAIYFWYHNKSSPVPKRTVVKHFAEKPLPPNAGVPMPVRTSRSQIVVQPETATATTIPATTKDKVADVRSTHAHAPKAMRKHIYFYKDGDFVGSPVDIFYGYVQVSVRIRDGWITDVKWLMDPEDIDLSQQINHDAMPKLTKEAIKVQNAQVDMISGASFTVLGFRTSMATALAQATLDRTTP